MIDHESARRSFVTSLDFPLEPGERDALDAHLADCPACRSFAAAARSDAATLREIDLGPVPVAVRANVAIAAERGRRPGAFGRWTAIVAVGALLLAGIGVGALGGGGRGASAGPSASPDIGNPQIVWRTDVVVLTAREFWIEVAGKTFRAGTPNVSIHSDPGDATYRTLEAEWTENGVEMRLNLYFKGDESAAWVDEIRIYDGAADGKWLTVRGVFFKTPVRATWTGDQDIAMSATARVHFGGLTVASHPSDGGVNEPPGGGIVVPVNANPFEAGGVLHCSGILQMTPLEAEKTLLGLGYKLSWRLLTPTGPNDPIKYAASLPSDGVIAIGDPAIGSSGELVIFVNRAGDPNAKPVRFPSDCPVTDPNRTPPPPAP